MWRFKVASLVLCAAAAFGCVGGGAASETMGIDNPNTPGGSVNVSQGGAQDIAQFRAIVEEGKVPSPDTLDPVGFFAEHAIDLPDADCGKDVCIHPLLAVAPRFNGGNWTMAFVAMNTSVDPSELERPPVHIAVTIEKSALAGIPEQALDLGLESLFSYLRPEDRVSVITFEEKAERHIHLAEPGSTELSQLITGKDLMYGITQSVGLYEGIAAAAKAFDEGDAAGFEGAHRVLLVTSGAATAGITDPDHIIGLGEALVEEGTAFGVIGVGEKFDNKIPAALGSMGAGTYAYALSQGDLADLLKQEGQTTLFPLATEFDLQVLPSKGYRVGRIYGTKRATATSAGATLSMPALFIGQRDGAADVGGSRRGGGGGLFVELLPDPATLAGVGADAPAFQVQADWNSASGGLPQNIDATLINSLPPGENPDSMWWNISDGGDGKPFMMLNMYLALKAVLDFYQAGDCERALGVVEMMQPPVSTWLGEYPDSDITDDNNLMLKLRDNVRDACEESLSSAEPIEPRPPQDFDGGCSSI